MDDPQPSAGRSGPSGGNPLATPAVAAALAVLLIGLAAAIVMVPGLLPGSAVAPTPGFTGAGESAAPSATGTSLPTGSPLASFVRPTPTPGPTFRTYVVRAGDSLSSIADDFLTSARSLAWWNRGTFPNLDPQSDAYDPNHIEPGWVLVLIPTVTVDEANPPTPSPGVTPGVSPGTAPG